MKKSKIILFTVLPILPLTITILAAITSLISCSTKNTISTDIISGDDTLYFANDERPFHTTNSCAFKVISSKHHQVLVDWNYDADYYATITGAQHGQKINSGGIITVYFNKQELPHERNLSKAVMFSLSNDNNSSIFEVTLVNDLITAVPNSLLKWSPANSKSDSGFWKLDGIANGVTKDQLKKYDTLLISADVTSISDNAFVDDISRSALPIEISNLLFTDNTKLSCYEIGANAFRYSGLTNIQIPKTITRICANAFGNINTIGYGESMWQTTKPGVHLWLGDNEGDGKTSDYYQVVDNVDSQTDDIIGQAVYPKGGLMYTTYNSLANSVQGLAWGSINIEMGDGQALSEPKIPESAYRNCGSMSGFNIIDQINRIGDYAFANSGGWWGADVDHPLPPFVAEFSFLNCLSQSTWNDSIIHGVNWGTNNGTPCEACIHVPLVVSQDKFNEWYLGNANMGYGQPPASPSTYNPDEADWSWPDGYHWLLPLLYDNYRNA